MFRTVNKGQASLVMILILAVAFIFYAISLNWTKIATMKTSTWMAAVSVAAQGGSMFASYGERIVQEQLLPLGTVSWNGGRLEYCDQGALQLVFKIIIIIIILIITILTYGATSPLLCWAVGLLLVAALVVEYTVIRPMMFSMWNKLNSNLRPVDQFRESPMLTGMQSLVNDAVNIPDRFDLDANGKWGFTGTIANDNISRFALFYTERLKLIKPPDMASFEAFKEALNNLIVRPPQASQGTNPTAGLGFASYCLNYSPQPYNNSVYSSQCDPSCQGVGARLVGAGYAQYVPAWVDDPENPPPHSELCQLGCNSVSSPSTCPPFPSSGPIYLLLYDPSLEQDALSPSPASPSPTDPHNSFRFRLGHDDEIHDTSFSIINDPIYVSGAVFPMLYQMESVTITTANLTVPGYSMFSDEALPPVNFQAPPNFCAQDLTLSDTGFYWKKGALRYCSGVEGLAAYKQDPAYNSPNVSYAPTDQNTAPNYHYPYFQCPNMFDSAGNQQACSTATANQWPQDNVDSLVYGLSDLIKFNKIFQGMDPITTVNSVDQWYAQLQYFIGAKCGWSSYSTTGLDAFVKANFSYLVRFADDPLMCNEDQQGSMLQWLYEMTNWAKQLNDPATGWLNQTFASSSTNPSVCSGTIAGIIACLDAKIIHQTEVNTCYGSLSSAPSFPYSLSPACTNLLSYLPTDFFTVPPSIGSSTGLTSAEYSNFQTWINDNRILMQTAKDRRDLLSSINAKALATAQLFQEGVATLGGFMASGGPAEDILKAVQRHKNATDRLPSFIIYGWKDQKDRRNNPSSSDGLWHLARVEDKQPSILPWVRAHRKGFAGATSCFTYQDGSGDIWARTTRWDDSLNGGLVKLANGTPLWQFKSENPKKIGIPLQYGASDLEQYCHFPDTLTTPQVGLGLTKEMMASLKISMANNPVFPANADEAKAYQEAFMINVDPTRPPPDGVAFGGCTFANPCSTDPLSYASCCSANPGGYYGTGWISYCEQTNMSQCQAHIKRKEFDDLLPILVPCWDAANDLLRTGVQAYAGARYGVPNRQPFHLGIFMHSEKDTKSKGYFTEFTFNDVPID